MLVTNKKSETKKMNRKEQKIKQKVRKDLEKARVKFALMTGA